MSIDAYLHKAQYLIGEEAVLIVGLAGSTDTDREFSLVCEITHLDRVTGQVQAGIVPGETRQEISLGIFEIGSYGVDVSLYEGGTLIDMAHTAFDTVKHPHDRMRYGFLSDFSEKDRDSADVDWMLRMHINYVQFYDWSYRHHDLVSEVEIYTDLMGKANSLTSIRGKIAACHSRGMRAMAYGAVYAAGRDFYEAHPEWVLRDAEGDPLTFIDTFYYMDIREGCPWHAHIIEEYRKAVACLDFDGIHMDTYGFPKRALSDSAGERDTVRLEAHFPLLIAHTREALAKEKDSDLIFNCVGNWPVGPIAGSPASALYIEVWPPYECYHHIQSLLTDALRLSNGRPVILAAYLAPFRTCRREDIAQAETAALLLTAAIISCGASHLLVGEDRAVLTQGYYADYAPMGDAFAQRLRRYYDFIVRYGDVFFDPEMKDVTMTHTGGDNREYVFSGAPVSSCGEAGKVWTIVREGEKYTCISFINLTACTSDRWNEGKEPLGIMDGMTADILLNGETEHIFWVSPEWEGGRAVSRPYTTCSSAYGQYMTVDIPAFTLWGVLVFVKSTHNNT